MYVCRGKSRYIYINALLSAETRSIFTIVEFKPTHVFLRVNLISADTEEARAVNVSMEFAPPSSKAEHLSTPL